MEYIAYDPNYNDDMDVDCNDSEDSDDYSDGCFILIIDDDMSWKVRRSACKLLQSLIESSDTLLISHYASITGLLIKRLSERLLFLILDRKK
jgi:cullin-associated NEDD8-dissociated protein 1